MLKTIQLLLLLMAMLSTAHTQSKENNICPLAKNFVTTFWREELAGKRLSLEGRRQALELFVDSAPHVESRQISIVSPSVPEEDLNNHTCDRVHFWSGFWSYGTLDQKLKFTRTPERSPDGARIGLWVQNLDVVQIGPGDFKFTQSVPLTIGVDTATKYVQQQLTTSGDPLTRRNAARTLTALRELASFEKRIEQKRRKKSEP